jgi:phospholipase/carboxylesterase
MELLHTVQVPPGDGPFPTIVLLHGFGASAHDLFGLAPVLHGGQALVLCPQGPIALLVRDMIAGFAWFPIAQNAPLDPVAYRRAVAMVGDWLDQALARYPVDRRKVVLGGFSQGGVLAYDLALRDPSRFAGLLALSAWLPAELADTIAPKPELESLPILVTHGAADSMIPVQRAQESVDRLRKLGARPAYREYPEMEHGIGSEALRDIVTWLEDKVFNVIQLAGIGR